MKTAWLIQSETNIHVGNENTSSVGLIDKEIQRDALTQIPCINASSLKGAMNEYATVKAGLEDKDRIAIFGVDKTGKKSDTQKGGCTFFDAHLLLLPVQDDKNLYKLVTSKETIEQYLTLLEMIGISVQYDGFINELKNHYIHFDGKEGKDNGIIPFSLFNELCSNDELPIIARNNLTGNGNLWYEQCLPQKAVFGTMIDVPASVRVVLKEKKDNSQESGSVVNIVNNVPKLMTDTFDGKIVQIGANASIGYGYCKFIKIYEEN